MDKVDAATLVAWLRTAGTQVVDIREDAEFAIGSIAGAVSAPLSRLPKRLDSPAGTQRVVFTCGKGARTTMAAGRLKGLTPLPSYALTGGIAAWRAMSPPVEP